MKNPDVEEILKGSFDLHVHAGPDPGRERRMDALDTARAAYESEMKGFVLKSHDYPTASLAYALNRMYPGLEVAGSVALNYGVGGLNPEAVRVAADLKAKVVWMPTFSAQFFLEKQGLGSGISLWEEPGTLRPEVNDILDIVAANDMVLASGHVSPEEAIALFSLANEMRVSRMIATHPAGIATAEQLSEMVSLGAFVEYTFLACMPSRQEMSLAELVDAVAAVGVEHCVVTTDFGQPENPPPAEGMRMAVAGLLTAGMSPDDVSRLVKDNPLQLVSG
jgi:hypothetical protein